jgi:hypothetical protein
VYRAFAQRDAAQIRLYERGFTRDISGPCHLSCVLDSAQVCLFLRERNARLSIASTINSGACRGARPVVMGFADSDLLIFGGRHHPLTATEPTSSHFSYEGIADDIPFRNAAEFADRYAAAVEADSLLIDIAGFTRIGLVPYRHRDRWPSCACSPDQAEHADAGFEDRHV